MDDDKKTAIDVTRRCLSCGKLFEFNRRQPNRKFCDENCRLEYFGITPPKHDLAESICRNCQQPFTYFRSTSIKLYCSFECAMAFNQDRRHEELEEDEYEESEECQGDECVTAFCENKQEDELEEEEYEENRYIEKRICQYCGKKFLSDLGQHRKNFCSSECSENARIEKRKAYKYKEERKCAHCGSLFMWHSNKPTQKYCSKECRAAATKIKTSSRQKQNIDEGLQNEIYLKVLDIISKMDQSKGASFGGKYIDYRVIGDISERTRDKVLERDSYECQVCKRKDSLHLHHLIKRKYGGNHDAENLITLCASCHRHIETGDLDHAVRKCFRNAKRYYSGYDHNKSRNRNGEVDIDKLKYQLTVLFDKLRESPVGDDAEIMICLAEALDMMDAE